MNERILERLVLWLQFLAFVMALTGHWIAAYVIANIAIIPFWWNWGRPKS